MVYLSRYGFAQTHYLKYRLRLTHRKRKKGNWMSLSPPPLLLKIGYFWSIKLRWGRWKNYLETNFFGWELFSSDGSTVGTLGKCISQNVPILVIANRHVICLFMGYWVWSVQPLEEKLYEFQTIILKIVKNFEKLSKI